MFENGNKIEKGLLVVNMECKPSLAKVKNRILGFDIFEGEERK